MSGVRYFSWKPESLEFLCAGQLKDLPDMELMVGNLNYKHKDHVVTLGEFFDGEGSTGATVPVEKRLKAWSDAPGSVAVYNAETWHLSGDVLSKIRTWEMKMLRRMFRLRWRPEDNPMTFNVRSSHLIQHWFRNGGVKMIHERILQAVYKSAWKETWFTVDDGDYPLMRLRQYRDRTWWEAI
eukprot:5604275-Karenia_brevis.AAC.1